MKVGGPPHPLKWWEKPAPVDGMMMIYSKRDCIGWKRLEPCQHLDISCNGDGTPRVYMQSSASIQIPTTPAIHFAGADGFFLPFQIGRFYDFSAGPISNLRGQHTHCPPHMERKECLFYLELKMTAPFMISVSGSLGSYCPMLCVWT